MEFIKPISITVPKEVYNFIYEIENYAFYNDGMPSVDDIYMAISERKEECNGIEIIYKED